MPIETTIAGHVVGFMWMPSMRGTVPFTYNIADKQRLNAAPRDFRDHVLSALDEAGRDFQSASFTGDTVVIVRSARMTKAGTAIVLERVWPITSFPSIADVVDAETYSIDFDDVEA